MKLQYILDFVNANFYVFNLLNAVFVLLKIY